MLQMNVKQVSVLLGVLVSLSVQRVSADDPWQVCPNIATYQNDMTIPSDKVPGFNQRRQLKKAVPAWFWVTERGIPEFGAYEDIPEECKPSEEDIKIHPARPEPSVNFLEMDELPEIGKANFILKATPLDAVGLGKNTLPANERVFIQPEDKPY